MEIKVEEMFKKGSVEDVCNELGKLITGKKIKLYEDNQTENYDFINDYNVQSVIVFEGVQLAIIFGPGEWDICSINDTDLIIVE